MRWVWLDEFTSIEREKRACAKRHFSLEEDIFDDHFPGLRVVPNPLLIEAMAQTGGVLTGLGFNFEKEVVLAKVPKAKFYKEALPPCELTFEAELKDRKEDIAFVDACVKQNGEKIGEASIIFACLGQLLPNSKEKIVFTPQFLQAFRINEIVK